MPFIPLAQVLAEATTLLRSWTFYLEVEAPAAACAPQTSHTSIFFAIFISHDTRFNLLLY